MCLLTKFSLRSCLNYIHVPHSCSSLVIDHFVYMENEPTLVNEPSAVLRCGDVSTVALESQLEKQLNQVFIEARSRRYYVPDKNCKQGVVDPASVVWQC